MTLEYAKELSESSKRQPVEILLECLSQRMFHYQKEAIKWRGDLTIETGFNARAAGISEAMQYIQKVLGANRAGACA